MISYYQYKKIRLYIKYTTLPNEVYMGTEHYLHYRETLRLK